MVASSGIDWFDMASPAKKVRAVVCCFFKLAMGPIALGCNNGFLSHGMCL